VRDTTASEYCVSIEAVSLVDGSTTSSEVGCVEAPPPPMTGDDLPEDTRGSDPTFGPCTAGGPGMPHGSALLAGFAFAALVTRRRRRR